MIINNLTIKNEGYVYCKSDFYSAVDILSRDSCFSFSVGVNSLMGEIDSGNWAISYLMSMYTYRSKDFILFGNSEIMVNDELISLRRFNEFSCYMDKLYPLFSNDICVKELVKQGLEYHKSDFSCDDIKNIFNIDDERFKRPLTETGNEIFKAMAAVSIANNKQVFCFPWLSYSRFQSYHENIKYVLKVLDDLKKIVIVPIGIPNKCISDCKNVDFLI